MSHYAVLEHNGKITHICTYTQIIHTHTWTHTDTHMNTHMNTKYTQTHTQTHIHTHQTCIMTTTLAVSDGVTSQQ